MGTTNATHREIIRSAVRLVVPGPSCGMAGAH
jgi:hypothetical protein